MMDLENLPEHDKQMLSEVNIVVEKANLTGQKSDPNRTQQTSQQQDPTIMRQHGSLPQISAGDGMMAAVNSLHQMQSQHAIGISTLQLEPTDDGNTMNKKPSRLSVDKINKTGMHTHQGGIKSPGRSPKSLVARIQIPVMDKEKQKQFHIASTLNLSEQSPLIPQEHPN